MDLFEKINRSFGSWYEGLFGGSEDVRPKDILRRILAALEDHRKEGFDNRVYVPNQYILEIAVEDEEEKEYLLSFLDRDELEAAVRRYCQQNHYHIRGALDFTIKEVADSELANNKRGEKVRVRCRYNTKVTGPESAVALRPAVTPFEERTVAAIGAHDLGGEEGGTVPSLASAALVIYAPDRPPFRTLIARGAITIGRSPKAGNDIVIESDGQISKRHARVELDADGQFTLYDLDSTNGTKVNGRRIDNRTLHDGDEIILGATRIMFQQSKEEAAVFPEASSHEGNGANLGSGRAHGAFGGAVAALRPPDELGSSTPPSRVLRARTARLILTESGQDVDEFLLASETLIGRGVTNDIVLPDKSLGTRHARIVHNGDSYTLEHLDATAITKLNGVPEPVGIPTPLKDGDRILLGNLELRFDAGS